MDHELAKALAVVAVAAQLGARHRVPRHDVEARHVQALGVEAQRMAGANVANEAAEADREHPEAEREHDPA